MQEKRQNLSARVSFAFFSAFFCYVRGLLFLIRGRWSRICIGSAPSLITWTW